MTLGLFADSKKVISEKFDGVKEEKNDFLLDTTRKRTEYFFSNYESLDSKPYEQKQVRQEEIKPMVRERKK